MVERVPDSRESAKLSDLGNALYSLSASGFPPGCMTTQVFLNLEFMVYCMIHPMKYFVYLLFNSSALVCKSPSVLIGARCYSFIHSGVLNEMLDLLQTCWSIVVQYFNLLPMFEDVFSTINPWYSDGFSHESNNGIMEVEWIWNWVDLGSNQNLS